MRRALAAAAAALSYSAETHKRTIRAHKRALHETMDALAEIHETAARLDTLNGKAARDARRVCEGVAGGTHDPDCRESH